MDAAAWDERYAASELIWSASPNRFVVEQLTTHLTDVMAPAGYPESSSRGDLIEGVDGADALEGVQVLHAGTAHDRDGRLVTAGGRVLAVTARGSDVDDARERAYGAVARIRFDGAQHRTDIGRIGRGAGG